MPVEKVEQVMLLHLNKALILEITEEKELSTRRVDVLAQKAVAHHKLTTATSSYLYQNCAGSDTGDEVLLKNLN